MTSLKEILEKYSFNFYPRTIGTPYQRVVRSYEELYYFVAINAPYYPLYISHNAFDEKYIYYQQMMFDLDTDTGKTLEDARQDTLKLYKYFDKYQKNISFSGNGFHLLVKFDNMKVDNFRKLSKSINLFHREVMRKNNITTNNIVCAEPKHLIRLPGSRHFGIENEKRFCIPLDIGVLDSDLEKIIQLSKLRDLTHFEDNKDKEVYKLSDILINDVSYQEEENVVDKISKISYLPDDIFLKILEKVLSNSLYEALFTKNPAHSIRVAAAIQIAKIIDSEKEFIDIFNRIAYLADWADKDNLKRRDYQVRYIYRRYGKKMEELK
jgi:hypothetical protein